MNLRSRLSTLIAARVILVTLLMGSAILIQISRPGAFPVDPFFALIGLTYALSVFYLATLRFAERHLWLVDLQFAVDALLVSAFIHVTGGITSNFSSLYLLPIIAASMIRFRRVAVQVAGLSAVMYLALVAVQYVDLDLPLARRFSPWPSISAGSSLSRCSPALWPTACDRRGCASRMRRIAFAICAPSTNTSSTAS
jgi:hypothetical protein